MKKYFYMMMFLFLAIIFQVVVVQAQDGSSEKVQKRLLDFMGINEFNFMRQYWADRRRKYTTPTLRSTTTTTTTTTTATDPEIFLESKISILEKRKLISLFSKIFNLKKY